VVSAIMFAIRRAAIANGLLAGGPIAPPSWPRPSRPPASGRGPRAVGAARADTPAPAGAQCGLCLGGRAGFYCGAHGTFICAACVSAHLIAQGGGSACSVAVFTDAHAPAGSPRAESGAP
jgi:hypothetical protein